MRLQKMKGQGAVRADFSPQFNMKGNHPLGYARVLIIFSYSYLIICINVSPMCPILSMCTFSISQLNKFKWLHEKHTF